MSEITGTRCSPAIERLDELFIYDPIIGTLTRRIDTQRGKAGFRFKVSKTIYSQVRVDGLCWQLHTICFAMHNRYWPRYLVDHKDRDKSNIKADNLREATGSQNQYNKAVANPNGKGVTWRDRKTKPWLAKIRVDGARINIGSFATREEAAAAYREACLKYHGDFACLE